MLKSTASIPEIIKEINRIGLILAPSGEIDESKINDSLINKLMEEFVRIYPTRTPGGRILSPSKLDTIAGIKIKKKLTLIVKKDVDKLKYIIKKLKDEIDYRKNTSDKIEYMKGIEVWLNNGDWENNYIAEKPTFTGVARGLTI